MTYGTKNRATGTTNLNEHSSRSHMVYTVYLSGESQQVGRSFASKMHLIDLAGSERLSKSGVTGDS
jgi:kinesin family protein C2/C3